MPKNGSLGNATLQVQDIGFVVAKFSILLPIGKVIIEPCKRRSPYTVMFKFIEEYFMIEGVNNFR